MEAASNAISSILKGSGQENTAVDETVAPAVEHETKTNKHETREQDVIEKERHQDHYHTTIQPLQDREELPEEHKHEQGATQYREVDHDDGGAKDEVDAQRAEFRNTSEQAATQESKTKEATVSGEHVHHHLHETIQPVIYKDTVKNTVTHKTNHIKEKHNEAAVNEGTTTNQTMSVDDFNRSLGGEKTHEKMEYEGVPYQKP